MLLKERVDKIRQGLGEPSDLAYLQELGESIKIASRCGLGQTSANPVLSTLKNMPSLYQALVKEPEKGMQPGFDVHAAVSQAEALAGRKSVHAHA